MKTKMCKEFWEDTAKRCAWTFAQAMLGCIVVGQTITEIEWKHALSVSAVATLACFFKQIVKYTEEDKTAAIIAKEMKQLREHQSETVEEPEDSDLSDAPALDDAFESEVGIHGDE